jgi:hypothetical protein
MARVQHKGEPYAVHKKIAPLKVTSPMSSRDRAPVGGVLLTPYES